LNEQNAIDTPASASAVSLSPTPGAAKRPETTTEERLPFTVKLVRDEESLRKAVRIRHAAYARHVPAFAQTLMMPEATDTDDGVAVLLAESKLDGSPLGTMRIQTNRFAPLSLEQSVELPEWLRHRSLAEATRLGITEDRIGRVVKNVLFKAYYQYCLENGIDWMVIAGRAPIDRQYDRLLFQDVYPDMGYIPLRHANNMPHRILAFDVAAAEARWSQARHPLLGFMCYTRHPDIDLQPGVITPKAGARAAFLPGDATTGAFAAEMLAV
jgi:hypothetical protein